MTLKCQSMQSKLDMIFHSFSYSKSGSICYRLSSSAGAALVVEECTSAAAIRVINVVQVNLFGLWKLDKYQLHCTITWLISRHNYRSWKVTWPGCVCLQVRNSKQIFQVYAAHKGTLEN